MRTGGLLRPVAPPRRQIADRPSFLHKAPDASLGARVRLAPKSVRILGKLAHKCVSDCPRPRRHFKVGRRRPARASVGCIVAEHKVSFSAKPPAVLYHQSPAIQMAGDRRAVRKSRLRFLPFSCFVRPAPSFLDCLRDMCPQRQLLSFVTHDVRTQKLRHSPPRVRKHSRCARKLAN